MCCVGGRGRKETGTLFMKGRGQHEDSPWQVWKSMRPLYTNTREDERFSEVGQPLGREASHAAMSSFLNGKPTFFGLFACT